MKENLKNAMTGLLVGDALGLPYQFLSRGSFTCTDMIGHGTYNMPAGSFSDDGSMALATLDSLRRSGRVDLREIADNFCAWLYEGKYTQYGTAYDMGGGTTDALRRYKSGADVHECGGTSVYNNGNGSLMRILPLAFFPHTREEVRAVSAITHAHEIAMTGCEIFIAVTENLLHGLSKEEAVQQATAPYADHPQYGRLHTIAQYRESEIRSSGYVVDTLEAALWCLLTTDNYRDCLLRAVNLGDDTDTVGAVVGGLAGLCYGIGGESGIPKSWVSLTTSDPWVQTLLS